jgi:hypothetical protein
VHRHAELDLLRHSTTELESALHTEISERRQLHMWPSPRWSGSRPARGHAGSTSRSGSPAWKQTSTEIESLRYADPAAVGVREFLIIFWAVEAKTNLLPDLSLFEDWTEGSLRHLRAAWKHLG